MDRSVHFIEVDLADLDLNQEHESMSEDSRGIGEIRVLDVGPEGDSHAPEGNVNARVFEGDNSHTVTQALALDSEINFAKKAGSFYDCNICLELAKEPVLTPCGHLFCWPCFYKVSKVDSTVRECPVCQGEVSDSSVIPIYGYRYNGEYLAGEITNTIPPRPEARRIQIRSPQRRGEMQESSYVPVSESIRQILRIGVPSPRIGNQLRHNADSAAGRGGRMQ